MSPFKSLRLVLAALPTDGQRRLGLLALATIAGGLFEFALLAALVGLIRDWLDGADTENAGKAALLFVAAALTAGVIRFALLTLTQRLAFDTGHRRSLRCSAGCWGATGPPTLRPAPMARWPRSSLPSSGSFRCCCPCFRPLERWCWRSASLLACCGSTRPPR